MARTFSALSSASPEAVWQLVADPARWPEWAPYVARRSWVWRMGPLHLEHDVEPVVGGARVTLTLSAPGPLEPLLAATYGPAVRVMVERLARVAAFNSAPASSTSTSA